MKITLTSTTKLVTINGLTARVWEGETHSGIKVHCFINRISLSEPIGKFREMHFLQQLKDNVRPSPIVTDYPDNIVIDY